MNSDRIEVAAKRISELTSALQWMREHGNQAINPSCRDTFGVHVVLNSCSALPGATEASRQLSAVARLLGREILANAITDAENTIEILRQQIADEVNA